VLAKAASGALEYVPIATVVNLARALDELHELHGFLVGLDSDGETDLAVVPMSAPLALVIGAEGKGLRHLTRQHCDVVARLAAAGTDHEPQRVERHRAGALRRDREACGTVVNPAAAGE